MPAGAGAPVLRDYQTDVVARVRAAYQAGSRRVLLVSPTGSGKTVTFSHILASAAGRGKRVLIVVHRVELLDQIGTALDLAGVPYGVIAPGHPETDEPVQIASVATLARKCRLERWRDKFDLVVVDECQHAIAGSWAAVLASQPTAHVLGVTATPERLDGRGLREIFDAMVEGPTTAALIAAGWLSNFTIYAPAVAPDLSRARIRAGDYATEDLRAAMDGIVIGAAVEEYLRLCPGAPAVAFCVDIAHSEAVAVRFREAGVRAAHLDGETSAADRRAAIAGLGKGDPQVIANCGLISEGLDVPSIVAAILIRPTKSLGLYLQMVGRALRPAPGKDRALILDFAGNVARHGFPDDPRAWSLDAKPRRQRDQAATAPLRRCAECGAMNRPNARACVECGADLRTPKERAEIAIRLRRAEEFEVEGRLRGMSYWARIRWAGADEERLRLVARVSGYKLGWVWHQLREQSPAIVGGVCG